MSPEVAHEPTTGEHGADKQHGERQRVADRVVSRKAHDRHESREAAPSALHSPAGNYGPERA